jgi:hypothetical protein
MEENQNPTTPTINQNAFYNSPVLPPPAYSMMAGFNNCRNFYHPFNAMAFNPYYPYAPDNALPLNYPLYCMPYQPCINF